MMLGEPVDLTKHAQAVTSLVRVASRLPIGRTARDITPDLNEYLRNRREVIDHDEEAAE